ncbi:MAG TPA: glycerate kinase [Patescibacteria group bacterium]|nr:glycerate kinase [Patescibacteria group bacterium]
MPLKVLIAPDKFKGTLTAQAASGAMARGWRQARPQDKVELLPITDGGDGFGEMMSQLMGAVPQIVFTCDAAHRPCKARWWWHSRSRTAIIETAEVIGLAKLPVGRYHPFELDTCGLGRVIRAVRKRGACRCLVGLGGSATNDAGFGMARALGWKFADAGGRPIECWTDLPRVTEIRQPPSQIRFGELIVAVDVRNPLLGKRGATRVYGPQKGLTPSEFPVAEKCLGRLTKLVERHQSKAFARLSGAGAAGGLGYGFAAFLDGQLESGFELFASEAGLNERLRNFDLVITGEGAMDHSTSMGKGTGSIARMCRDLGIPCIGLAGVVKGAAHKRLFAVSAALTELATLEEAKNHAAKCLQALARQVATQWCETANKR